MLAGKQTRKEKSKNNFIKECLNSRVIIKKSTKVDKLFD